MAVIEKLRNNAPFLIGIVAVSLAAFILGDFLTSNQSFLSGPGTTVGEIGGKKVDINDFERRVQSEIENYKLNQNVETVDNNMTDQLRDQTWNKIINEMIMGDQYKKLGITVSAVELADMVKGKNIHPQIRQAFTDPNTGVFNPASVINFLKNMDNDPTGKTKRQWLLFERAIYEERMQQKYNDLVKQGLYVSTPEAKMEYENRNRSASIKYIMLAYNSIPDSTVQVSDEELKKVFNRNQKKYKQESSRAVDYVVFDVLPSEEDRKSVLADLGQLKEEFASTTDDSAFVAANSDEPINLSYRKQGTIDFQIDSFAFSAPVGSVTGPYERMGTARLVKIADRRSLPDSVNARHILIRTDANVSVEAAMATADSLKNVIKKGGNFAALAMQHSADDGSKIKGGDLGWFAPGQMVPSFNDACFEGKTGDMPIVASQFGVHLIEILGQKGASVQVKLAEVVHSIEPGSKTYQAAFQKANDFAANHTSRESFEKGVKEQNLTKLTENNVLENSRQIGPVENSRELVRWAFNNDVGTTSKAFEFGNKFVVAVITDAREKGNSTMEQVKDELMAEARKDKKAEMLIEKAKAAGSAENIDALAQKLNQTVYSADNFNLGSPYLPNAGHEPYVAGVVSVLKSGTLSQPLKGTSGVYIVSVTNVTEPAAAKDYKDIKTQLTQQLQQRSQYEVFNALREKADITDNRGKFY